MIDHTEVESSKELKMKIRLIFFICALSTPLIAYAENWSSCQMGFSSISMDSQIASTTANNINSINRNIEQLKQKLRNCQNDPKFYDLMKDGCAFDRQRYNSEIDRYNREVDNLNAQVSHLTMTFKSTLSSCGYK
jgi:hypothetical protein